VLAKPSPLALALAISAGLHAGIVALPSSDGGDRFQSAPPGRLSAKVVTEQPADARPAPRPTGGAEKAMPRPAKYYTSKEVDVMATPLELKTSFRTSDNFPLGRIATVKLRLFINEHGIVDRFEILEADQLPDENVLDDFRAVVFRPAELAGRPVKSQKVVGLSFVP
jgi:hypothetical protein